MVPSYQTVPLANVPKANAPKDERASTPVRRKKKVAVAAMMIGMALLVAGYSYGSNVRIDIATTTSTMTATAANLVRGGVRNGDNSLAATDGGLGISCCKVPSYNDCRKTSPSATQSCVAINGYGGKCHSGDAITIFNDYWCCNDNDLGTKDMHFRCSF